MTLRVQMDGQTHEVHLDAAAAATPITELLRRHGFPLNTRCGQRGLCEGCVIDLSHGSLMQLDHGHPINAPQRLRACRVTPTADDATIQLPARSLLAHQPRIVSAFHLNVTQALDPYPFPAHQPLGLAVDIGTTTVAVMLIDLRNGNTLATATAFNEQMHRGDDVLTRINLCSSDKPAIQLLQQDIVSRTLEPLVHQALSHAGATPDALSHATLAGNTTMLHLLTGTDPSTLGVAPFTPVFLDPVDTTLGALGFSFAHAVHAHLLPGAAAYVGADLTAGALASGLIYDDGPSLLVDVGTNGEIILKHGPTLLGCATAAGPAFEGSRLYSGMRATDGAIAHVNALQDPWELQLDQLGEGVPVGLCGSAYVDLLAELRRTGVLSPSGRFCDDAPEPARQRYVEKKYGRGLRVARGRGAEEILFTELDAAALLQAKAAIAAGIVTLLRQEGLTARDVKHLYLAGGFGMHLNLDSAIGMGLLPGFHRDQIQLLGNTSLAGAYLSLLDHTLMPELHRIARRVQIVELNLVPTFEDEYIEQLSMA